MWVRIMATSPAEENVVAGWERSEAPPCKWINEGRRTHHWRIRVPARRRDKGRDPRRPDQRGIVKPDGSCIYWDDGSNWERLDKQYDQDLLRTLPDPQRFAAHAQHHQLIPWLTYCLKHYGFAIIQEALDDTHTSTS